ncbi:MAG: BrnA antitoxin family protein [Roseicyclus sp.]|nr:BrnA antitoxin family protein [Roseicyclus sp.]MBO6626622.1 BrnA antitoxin family protein [Roseicyclus sp.]MBO6921852.1 BrnA antitoxin family protein [Roseicyclus sp.]
MDPFDDKPLTKRQRYDHYYMMEAMQRFEWDMHHKIATHFRIPNEWHEISQRRERKKTRITMSVDEDVVKWFKSMGPGYQPRMNDVLRSFMHAKLMGLLKGDDTKDMYKEGLVVGTERLEWGGMEERLAKRRERLKRER